MCRAFGTQGEPVLLSDASLGAWRVGWLVLKQIGDPVEADYIAVVSAALPMVARPVQTDAGDWLAGGWGATEWIDAKPEPERWDEVLAIGEGLHAALKGLRPDWPDALAARTTPWAIADRVAWHEQPVPAELSAEVQASMARALELVPAHDDRPVQVVHCDLAGNVLFPARGPGVVIDLSPYRRPVGFATAVAMLDQICWHGAPAERSDLIDPGDLARAAVFRIVAAALQSEAAGRAEAERATPLLRCP